MILSKSTAQKVSTSKNYFDLTSAGFLCGILLTAGVITTTFRWMIPQVNDLYPLTLPSAPYFIAAHAGLLYLVMPVVALSSIIFMMAPGILSILAWGKTSEWSVLALKGFAINFPIYFLLTGADKLLFRKPIETTAWITIIWLANLLAAAALLFQVLRGRNLLNPFHFQHNRRRLAWTLGIPLLLVILLLPILFWQDLNPDGVEALMLGRSLLEYQLPRLPVDSGLVGLGLGMVAGSYPVSWFVMLFGAMEATARLPLLIYLPVIFMTLIAVIELGGSRRLRLAEEGLLALILAVFVTALAYNDSYHVYSADIASPALFDILVTLCILALVYFLWQGDHFWFLVFAVLGLFTRPTSLLVLGLMIPATLLSGDKEKKRKLLFIVQAIAICLVLYIIYEKPLASYITQGVGTMEEPGSSILFRLRYLTLFDFKRILFILIPTGVLPALALLAFWMHDPLSRFVSFLSLAYFLFFYVVAFVALHHFAPTMVLPLIVFGRILLEHKFNKKVQLAGYALASLSLFLSLPPTFTPDRLTRLVGQETLYKVGSLHDGYAGVEKAFGKKDILDSLFRENWDVADPSKEYIGSPGQIVYYSSQPKQPESPVINYLVQPSADPAPVDFTEVVNDGDVTVFVRDITQWNRDRFRNLNTDFRSKIYFIPREVLFKFMGVPVKAYTIDLVSLLPRSLAEMLISRVGHPAP